MGRNYINSTSPSTMNLFTSEYDIKKMFPCSKVISSPLLVSMHHFVEGSDLGKCTSLSIGVLMTLQKTDLSTSGFSIISSFRESLNVCKCVGNEFVNAVAYNEVKRALCLTQ
jgi:hypothetical protein